MKDHGRLLVLTMGVAAIAGSGFQTMSAHAAAPTNGCPAGYELLSVATLTSDGYKVPGRVDDPTSGVLSYGRPGNGDGLVCGVPLGNRRTAFGAQLYNFMDDTLPAS